MHYEIDEQTGIAKFIGKEEITVDTAEKVVKKTAVKAAKIEENTEPLITLDPNKLILTTGAVQMLNVCPDCRIDIKYKKRNKVSVPVVGTDTAFGTKGGKINIIRKYDIFLEFCRSYKELYELLSSKNGENCDVNPVVTFEITKGSKVL